MLQHTPAGTSIVGEDYESLEFSITGAQTHYNIKTQITDAFTRVTKPSHIVIRADVDIVVKFSTTKKGAVTSDNNRAITIEAGTVFVSDGMVVTNIFITTTATTAVKIIIS